MNLLNQLRFGGVFGGVIEYLRSTATESTGVVVRPGRFERPTFCSGVYQSPPKLLRNIRWHSARAPFLRPVRRLLHNSLHNCRRRSY